MVQLSKAGKGAALVALLGIFLVSGAVGQTLNLRYGQAYSAARSIFSLPVAVAAGNQTDLDEKGIAKTAREEKLRARAEAKKADSENERMAALYRQHVLKETPAEPVIQIKGLGSKKKEPVQEVLHKPQQ